MTRSLKYFLICYFADGVMAVASMVAMLLLAARFNGIGHWTTVQVVFMLGYGSFMRGLANTFFSYNMLTISRRIGRGQLDHTLLIPQSVWMSLLTEGFAPIQNSATLLPGLALLIWSLRHLGLTISWGWVGLLAVNLLASCIIMFAFSTLWGCLAFWAPRAAEEVCSPILGFMEELRIFPLNAAGPLLLGLLTTVLPVGFLAWYPSQALLGMNAQPWSVAVTPMVAGVVAAATVGMFSLGMRHYVNTGSQRYSGYGFRR